MIGLLAGFAISLGATAWVLRPVLRAAAPAPAPPRECASCGQPLEPGSRFCSACGATVSR